MLQHTFIPAPFEKQLPFKQSVPVEQRVPDKPLQTPAPSHCLPLLAAEQVVPVLSSPLVTVTLQVPLPAPARQLRQGPQLAALQHTESTQLPLVHSLPPTQPIPNAFLA
jgi:hypothetical protein